MLPQISPAPLTSQKEPIGHPNWIFELKHDGFRGVLYVDREQAWLVSRKGNKFRQFDPLLKQVLRSLKGKCAILDGEIVVLDEKGRSNFYDLMAHRGERRSGTLKGSRLAKQLNSPTHFRTPYKRKRPKPTLQPGGDSGSSTW